MRVSKKSKLQVKELVIVIVAITLTICAGIFMPEDWFKNVGLAVAFYVILIRVLIVGDAMKNLNYYTGNETHPIICYIPWVQNIVIIDSKFEKIMYLLLPPLSALVFFVGTSKLVLGFATFANVESIFTIVQYISVGLMVIWLLMCGKINGHLLFQAHNILQEEFPPPETGVSGFFQVLSTVWLYMSCVSFALPLISTAGNITLMMEARRLAGLKNKKILEKKRSSRGVI